MSYILLLPFLLLFGIVFIIIYVLLALLLSNLHKKIYGRKSVLAWIPILNLYILGKVTTGRLVGLLLVGANLISFNYKITINGVVYSYSLLSSTARWVVATLVAIISIILYGVAIVKFIKISSKDILNEGINEAKIGNTTPKKVVEAEVIKEETNVVENVETVLNCRNCGAPAPSNKRFCPHCGSSLIK